MTTRSFRKPHGPRRAAAVDPAQALASTDQHDETSSLVRQGLAALAVSALGLGLAASVSLTAGAQSAESSRTTVAGQSAGPATEAQAAPPAPQAQGQEPAETNRDKQTADPSGDLGAFNRGGSNATSRNAVRAEIDRAVADQKARERGASLSEDEEKQSETSGRAVQDARATNLVNATEATKREQARLAEEKRKAEEALKAGQAAAPGSSNLPAPAAADPGLAAPSAAPAAAVPAGAQGVSPMNPGSYSLGARWGAVGSWSRYHTGQDMPAPIGTPLRAAAAGVVLSPNGGGWAGTHVVIKHADGSATLYAHMSSSLVRPGQTVTAGQPIGAVGMTGRTFGPHLHFEHYPQGVVGNPYVTDDPYAWMLRLGVRL